MKKRTLCVGLMSVLAVASLAVISTAAPAAGAKPKPPPVWSGCKGEQFKFGGKCQTISWGTLTFQSENSELGSITCKKSDAGNIWNPLAEFPNHLPGLDEVVLMDFYECKSSQCQGATVTARNLPWQTELFRVGTAIFDRITGIELEFTCKSPAFNFNATGTLSPKMVNGNPLYEEFTAASGALASPAGKITITGHDKNMGFENQERLKVK